MLSNRQQNITMILHEEDDFVTIANIASQVGVSTKTVRNDIGSIKKYFQEKEIGGVMTKPHAGVKLIATQEQWEKYLFGQAGDHFLEREEDMEFAICYRLLKKKKVTYAELELKFFLTRLAIDKMVEIIRTWFKKIGVEVEKKKGKGITIIYDEFQLRLAMWHMYQRYKNSITCKKSNTISNYLISPKDFGKMVELLEGFDLNGTIVALRHVEEKYSIRFSYDGSLYATFLIAVGILNARRRWYVQMKPLPKCKTDSTYNEMICMELQDKLEEYYEITLPKEEQEWLTFVIAITEIQEFGLDSARQKCEIMNNELCRLTLKVITLASDITNIDLRKDTFLASRLFLDLKAMIERMKYKAYFKNALLKQVKQKYPVIYAVAWSISVLFDKELGLDINEDEIGYLALQLGGAIERNSAVLKACIVCNYGFGISQMLTEKVERSISDIEIVEILSNRDVRKIQTSDCDFIISTLDLKEIDCNKECVVVEHLLLPYDINNIEMRMRQIRKERLSNQSASQRISLSKHLFKSELMCLDVETSNKRRLLQDMCTQLESQGYVTTEFEQSVLEREEITSTEVGKGIALAHGYARYVIRPIIAVATLREPIIWAEGEKVDMVFLLAFDLKESMGMRNEIVRFYKSFAAFLENDNAVSQMKSCTEVDEMEKLLNEL